MTDPTEPELRAATAASPIGSWPAADLAGSAPPLPVSGTPPRRQLSRIAIVALVVVGLVAVLGGGAALARELTRRATPAEQSAALAREIGSRWERLQAGGIFPATVSYVGADGEKTTATRAGIAPQTSCLAALEPAAFRLLHPLGCAAMLRATYIDATGTQAVTIGIAIMASASAVARAQGDLQPLQADAGLYALPVAGTIADIFGNAERGTAGAQIAGPYLLLYTAGYTDGMPGSAAAGGSALNALGLGVLAAVEPTLTRHSSPCTMKDIEC